MMNSIKLIPFMFFMLAILSTAGCQTLRAPSTMYEEWKPAVSKPFDGAWNSILEQKIDPSRPLALVELVDIALHNNPSTRQAWDTARAAEAKKRQAESALYPQVTASASLEKERLIASQKKYNVNSLGYGPGVNITYLILDFGGRAATIDAAYEAMIMANFQFNQAFQDLLLSVETSYYELHSSYASLKAAEADMENAKTSFAAARQRYEVGLVAKLDVLQAKSNYENSLFNLEVAKGQIKTAKANLAKAIGFPADTPFDIAEPAKEVPTQISDENVSSLIKEAIANRPDISALQASLREKQSLIKAAKSDLWPKLNGTGGGKAAWHKFPVSQASENEHEYGYSAELSFDWDVFDGFYNINKVRETRIEAEVERSKLMQAELEASADVWIKYYDFRTAVRKLVFSESFLDTSKMSYDLALESYKAGLKSMLDLLDAESKLSDARSKLIQSKKDIFVALANLAHATGSISAKTDDRTTNAEITGDKTND